MMAFASYRYRVSMFGRRYLDWVLAMMKKQLVWVVVNFVWAGYTTGHTTSSNG